MTEPQRIIWSHVKYFKRDEWKKNPDKVSAKLIYTLDLIRETSGWPIIVHVAWDDSGHSPHSLHYHGMAVDFHFQTDLKKFPFIDQFNVISLFRGIGGIGFYPYWNHPGWHIDLRDGEQRLIWYRDKKGKYIYDPYKVLQVIKHFSNI